MEAYYFKYKSCIENKMKSRKIVYFSRNVVLVFLVTSYESCLSFGFPLCFYVKLT